MYAAARSAPAVPGRRPSIESAESAATVRRKSCVLQPITDCATARDGRETQTRTTATVRIMIEVVAVTKTGQSGCDGVDTLGAGMVGKRRGANRRARTDNDTGDWSLSPCREDRAAHSRHDTSRARHRVHRDRHMGNCRRPVLLRP